MVTESHVRSSGDVASGKLRLVVPEAPLDRTEHGLVPSGDGWYVLNAREARWWYVAGRGGFCDLEGGQDFPQLGINVQVLAEGEAMAMYHWEADQEDFLIVSGEAILIVEGKERPLRPWDFVHCPPDTKHTIVGAGAEPCVVVAVGAREHQDGPDWGGYSVDEVALRREAGVEQETTVPDEAYAAVREKHGMREQMPYRDGWLPDLT
jgi:uncharacterized cupin superfamily protein